MALVSNIWSLKPKLKQRLESGVWHASVALNTLLCLFFVVFLVWSPQLGHLCLQNPSRITYNNGYHNSNLGLGPQSFSGSSPRRPLPACQGTIDVLNVTYGQWATSMVTNGVQAVPGQRRRTSEYKKHKVDCRTCTAHMCIYIYTHIQIYIYIYKNKFVC